MKSKEEMLKEKEKQKTRFKCWSLCKKCQQNSCCPRCLAVIWGWILFGILLIIIAIVIIYCVKN